MLLYASPVSLEFGCLGSDILRVSSVTGEHPQLVEVVEGVLTEHTHELVGLARIDLVAVRSTKVRYSPRARHVPATSRAGGAHSL